MILAVHVSGDTPAGESGLSAKISMMAIMIKNKPENHEWIFH